MLREQRLELRALQNDPWSIGAARSSRIGACPAELDEDGLTDRRLQRKLEKESRLADKQAEVPRRTFNPARSGLVTASLLVLGLLAFSVLWRAHQRAAFHQLTTPQITQVATTPQPGGQEPATISRVARPAASIPEFVGATILPGLGMQVLQLAVSVPGHGVQNLLAAPTVTEIADTPSLKPDAAPFHLTLSAPGQFGGNRTDLIAESGATGVSNRTEANGGEVTGTFSVVDATGQATGVEAKVDSTLTGRSFDVEVRLRNNALVGQEYALDWSPKFRADGGDLSRFLLSIPATARVSGSGTLPVEGSPFDFSGPSGKHVPNVDFDETYVALRRETVGEGPVVRLTDLQRGIALRIVLLSPSIRSVRAHADATTHALMLSFGTDDGLQRTALQAGESADWRVRIDVLPLGEEKSAAAAAPL